MIQDEHASVVLAAQVREVARLWRELEKDLPRHPRPSRSEKVTRSESMPPAPGDVDVMDARLEVEEFAAQYARILVRSSGWREGMLVGTADQLAAIARRIGHFTEHPAADLRRAFASDVERVTAVAESVLDPDPTRWTSIGVKCTEPGCPGWYRIPLPDVDDSMSDAQRTRALKDSRPVGVCSKNHRHTMDARVANRMAVEALR